MVFSPTKCFFRSNQHLVSSDQARAIFRTLRQQYGELIDYKVVRCPESQALLRYGYVVFKHQQDAKRAINDQFIKVDSPHFDRPCEVKIEASQSKGNNNNNNSKQ